MLTMYGLTIDPINNLKSNYLDQYLQKEVTPA